MKKNNPRSNQELKNAFIVLIALLVLLVVLGVAYYFTQTHFLWGTTIENVSCSFLSVEKAIEKINLEKESKIVTFCFTNSDTYNVEARYLGVHIDESRVAEIFEQQQLNPKESKKYDLNGFILVDSDKLRTFLEQLPELQKENMVEPQNAYIIWDEIKFTIREEELGNVIDFEEAMKFSMEQIKCDEEKIDFSSITHITPEILAEDLVSEQKELNSILNSSINYELSDGSIVTLDSNIIKNWVYQDENGKFKFDIENGVSQFVEELAIKVNDANSFMQFAATDCEELATVNVPWEVRPQLDKNSEIDAIKCLLGKTEKIYKILFMTEFLFMKNFLVMWR